MCEAVLGPFHTSSWPRMPFSILSTEQLLLHAHSHYTCPDGLPTIPGGTIFPSVFPLYAILPSF